MNVDSRDNYVRFLDLVVVSLSSLFLVLSFPQTNYVYLSLFAFLPLFLILEKLSFRKSFQLSYFCGMLFFAGFFYWLGYVTVVGAYILCCYFALYFAVFGWGYCFIKTKPILLQMIFLSSLWVVLEYVRGHLFTGLPWGFLGHIFYQQTVLIQTADITGVYGISFMVMFINVLLKELVLRIGDSSLFLQNKDRVSAPIFITLLLVVVIGVYGYCRMYQIRDEGPAINIAVVQPNASLEEKWQEVSWPKFFEQHMSLSRSVVTQSPDVIVWPETSFPGILDLKQTWKNDHFDDLETFVHQWNVPIVMGVVRISGMKIFNSVVLHDGNKEQMKHYDKNHLVPFGEFIPFRKNFPWISDMIPIDDFDRGEGMNVLSLSINGVKKTWGALICFEDSISELSRKLVRNGAEFFINVSNDGWFKDTKEPFIHLQTAVFRSVENKRNMLRVGNVGVSCVIDSFGRIKKVLHNEDGKSTYVSGSDIFQVYSSREITFYTKFGDVFVWLCMLCIGGFVVSRMYENKNR